ncbi:MAG TPA: hypothetical protein VKJ45_21440 [Blastocatellia bacterium]|nr:hypothetical protein [Blastocatellia bacterium]
MNQQNLGRFTPGGPDKVLGICPIDPCWCAESYYEGSDGVGRVVSSAGDTAIIWKLQTSPNVTLVMERTLPAVAVGQDPGFFTWVSSNGNQAGTAVIWAVSRPANTNPANDLLYAFNPADGSLLFSANAGTWPNPGNANIVPVVAIGRVFVASNQQLAIFGPIAVGAKVATSVPVSSGPAKSQIPASANQVSGWVDQINGTELVVRKRNGAHVTIAARPARDVFRSVHMGMEEAITAEGNYDAQGVLHAQTIVRAKNSRDLWPPDR